jgi:mono/diheme cytochrome c family protein
VRYWVCAALLLAGAPGAVAADGKAVFDNNCAVCHQAGGVGVPGQFPRLAGRAGTIAAKPEGKAFLPQVVLNGMGGRITVDGDEILGAMPALDSLSDDDIAAVLTYITGLEHKPVIYTAAEIKRARAMPRRGPGDMVALHKSLAAKKVVP